jgi:hypothetical protein
VPVWWWSANFPVGATPEMTMNWRPMVQVSGRSEWSGNGLVFATKQEAEDNAKDLMQRWTLVTDTRADETDNPVNYKWTDGRLVAVETIKTIMKSILIIAFSAVTLLALASGNAEAQYTNNKPLTQRPLPILPRPNFHQSEEARENMLQQQQMFRQDQDNFRHQMDSAGQQGLDMESRRELREKLREMLDR